MAAKAPPRRPGGPKPRYDARTAKLRQREQSYRYRRLDADIVHWFAENEPTLYARARAQVEAALVAERGLLPGDPPNPTGESS